MSGINSNQKEAIHIPTNDAKQELFEPIEIFGKPALFTNGRIDRETIPSGFYAYDMRHGDSGNPLTLERFVVVNHYGTIILNRPIAMTQNDRRRISLRNINYTGENMMSLQRYMEKHPPYRKDQER